MAEKPKEAGKPAAKKQKKFKPYKKGRFCPKCGKARLAEHKDRLSCGKCGYMEKR